MSVLFIPGLWIHSTAWDPWRELFARAGYDSAAPGWPGEARNAALTARHPSNSPASGCRS